MAIDDNGSASPATGVSNIGPSSPSQAPPAPTDEADALLTVSPNPPSPKTTTAMAEAEEDKIRDFMKLTGIVDRDRCIQILAAFGWELNLAVASTIPADPASLTTDAASSAPPLGAHPIMPTAASPPHQPGIAWRLFTLPFDLFGGGMGAVPFYLVSGGMGVILGTLRLSAWAVCRASDLAQGGAQRLLQLLPSAGSKAPVSAADKAKLLPPDVLIEVARRLRASRRDVQSMRSVCLEWRAVIPNTNGPWLVLSRRQEVLPPDTQRIVVLQMLAHAPARDGAARIGGTMAIVPCLSCPPSSATCWGAAHGLVALRESGTKDLYLFCLVCGSSRILPPLSSEMTAPCGIFFNEHPLDPLAILSVVDPMAILSAKPGVKISHPRLHYELTNSKDAQRLRWVIYPGTEAQNMKSVSFDDGTHFIGATSANMVIIDELDRPRGHDMVFLEAPMPEAGRMLVWGSYGHHVFKCSNNIFFCLLLRDFEDADIVGATVFLVQPIPGAGYRLVPTSDIGSHAVYLGANKPVVLPAEDGSFIQRRNTIYIADDDGTTTNGRVLCIDLSSHEVSSMPFPDVVSINDYGYASWVAAPPLDGTIWHMWHCNN